MDACQAQVVASWLPGLASRPHGGDVVDAVINVSLTGFNIPSLSRRFLLAPGTRRGKVSARGPGPSASFPAGDSAVSLTCLREVRVGE